MSDHSVQRYLEAQVPELKALIRVGMLSAEEVKQLVSQRRNFEYAVLGTDCTKATWQRYIEYELRLEALRKMRAQRLGVKKGEAQYGPSIRRLHALFQRATRRFNDDLELWMQWVVLAKQTGSNNVLSKSIAGALMLHPLVPSLWIIAADWEFSNNANIVAARTLMLRGLRANGAALELWLEYFRLEMAYLNKILTRLNLVRTAGNTGAAGDEQSSMMLLPSGADATAPDVDSDGELAGAANPEGGGDTGAAGDAVIDDAELALVPDSAFAKGAVVLAVFQGAMSHATLLVDRVEDAWKFLTIARDLSGPPELLTQMEALLRDKFGALTSYWATVAREQSDVEGKLRVLREAAGHVAGAAAFDLAVTVLAEWPDRALEQCAQAEASNEASPFVYCAWMSMAMQSGQLRDALAVGTRALQAWPADAQCWFQVVTVHVALLRGGDGSAHAVRHVFKDALRSVGAGEPSFALRALYIRFLFAFPDETDVSKVASVVAPMQIHEQLSQLAELALQCAFRAWPLDKCRELCATMLDTAPSLAVFEACLAWEREPELKRHLFADCAERFGDSVDVWLAWARFEEEQMNLDEAGRIHWRARRELKGEALTKYLELSSAT